MIALLIVFRTPRLIIAIFFLVILSLDVLAQLSFIYLFSLSEFINNSRYVVLYDFSFVHYLMIALFIGLIALVFYSLKKMTLPKGESTLLIAAIFAGLSFTFYVLDFLNGRTLINNRKIVSIADMNIGASALRDLVILVRDLRADAPMPQPLTQEAITFKTFKDDSLGNQLLILVESWGLPVNSQDWGRLQTILEAKANAEGWLPTFGSTAFKGGTVHAELRELLNVSGDFHYLLDADQTKGIRSIFNIKKDQGYSTMAIHSFSNEMFQRAAWWKNIGADSTYFLENVVNQKHIAARQLNYSSPFTSLNDEDAFLFINDKNKKNKTFAYFLTVNTHLPFNAEIADEKKLMNCNGRISDDADNQLNRILELLSFFIVKMDSGNWSKVLIMGDHTPPFTRDEDRNFYSTDKVPYMVLVKQVQAVQ